MVEVTPTNQPMEAMNFFRIGLAQVDVQASTTELFGVVLGPLVLGVLMFLFGLLGERAGIVKPGIKWLGMVPLLIGMLIGWDYFKKVTGEEGQTFVMLNMIEKKRFLYYGAFIAPLIGAIALPIWAILAKRRPRPLTEDEAVLDEEYEDAGEDEEYYEEDEFEEGEEEEEADPNQPR